MRAGEDEMCQLVRTREKFLKTREKMSGLNKIMDDLLLLAFRDLRTLKKISKNTRCPVCERLYPGFCISSK